MNVRGIFTTMMHEKYFMRAVKRFLDAEEATRDEWANELTWKEYHEARKVLEAWSI